MRILTVIPIAKGISKDTLTYFAKEDVSIGSIVSIPIRSKKGFGLVIDSKPAEEIKSEIKSLSYSIKKIEYVDSHTFLTEYFVESAKKIAQWNAGSLGATLSTLIPKVILEENSEVSFPARSKASGVFFETLLLQSDDLERFATYKSLIREEFAKGRSVLFCLPTTEDLLQTKSLLEKGIEKYTYIIHSGLSKKDILATWKKIAIESHPILVITTGSFLALPINNLGTIVLEKESSRGYKMQTRPFIDIRQTVEILAKEMGIRLVLGDTLLRIETLWEIKNPNKNSSYSELSPLKFRSLCTAECEIVSMRTPMDQKKKEFQVFGEKLKEIIRSAIENNENIFLFCGRKGFNPVTVCSDCGTVVVCKNCEAPVVLYRKKEMSATVKNNLFVCNHCGERRDAGEVCVHCKGWRLNPLGIGTEKVFDEVMDMFPKAKVMIMDKDNVTTHKQAVKVRDTFYNTPGCILVGTEMALTYLNQSILNTAVVSMDSYFSIPDFKINEKIFHILLELRNLSEKSMLIQTRQENTKIFDYATRGNLIDFYRDEIEDRKSIGYPPFTTYIKISIEGEKVTIKKEMSSIAEFMKPFELNIFDAWNPGSKSKYTIHGLISLPKGAWVDKNLLEKLRSLPPHCIVRVDPVTLL